ncbi:hypothetical protein RV10_GL001119 [Enterococcus pallens]|nr:hypothetical protein RV10_GL001119 [Enterococcus pallens]
MEIEKGSIMKKKMVCVLFAMVTILSLTACAGNPRRASRPARTTEETSSMVSETTEETSSSELLESSSSELPETGTTSSFGNSSNFSLMVEAAQSQVPSLMEQVGGMYSNITITEGENTTIVYTYTFAQDPGVEVDSEALKPTMVKGMKPVIDGMKGMFPDIKLQVLYLKPDGSELANFVITPEDTNQLPDEPA